MLRSDTSKRHGSSSSLLLPLPYTLSSCSSDARPLVHRGDGRVLVGLAREALLPQAGELCLELVRVAWGLDLAGGGVECVSE